MTIYIGSRVFRLIEALSEKLSCVIEPIAQMTSDASLVLTIRGPLIIRARIVGIPGCPWLIIRGAKIAMVPIPSFMVPASGGATMDQKGELLP